MAETLKVLGQAAPANTSNADLYTVPSAKSAVVSTIAIANTSLAGATARIFVRVGGAAAATSNAIAYDLPVAATSTITLTLGITLAAADVVSIRSNTASALTFHMFGSEIS